jgi:hypothetical protein
MVRVEGARAHGLETREVEMSDWLLAIGTIGMFILSALVGNPTSFPNPPASPSGGFSLHSSFIGEGDVVLVVPKGNLMARTPEGLLIRTFYLEEQDWDVLGTLR